MDSGSSQQNEAHLVIVFATFMMLAFVAFTTTVFFVVTMFTACPLLLVGAFVFFLVAILALLVVTIAVITFVAVVATIILLEISDPWHFFVINAPQ